VADAASRRHSLAMAVAAVLAFAGLHLVVRPSSPLGADNVALAALGALAVAAGDASRSRRAYLAEVEARARHAEADREVEAARRVTEERLRIARDLHDVVGHGMGAITVQAGTGRMALAAGADDEVRRALLSIEQAGRGVLREVRWLVGVLRDRPDEVNLGDLPALADAARSAGFDVRMTVDGDLGSVPQPTGEAAYRIVQEALTNAFSAFGVRIGVGARQRW